MSTNGTTSSQRRGSSPSMDMPLTSPTLDDSTSLSPSPSLVGSASPSSRGSFGLRSQGRFIWQSTVHSHNQRKHLPNFVTKCLLVSLVLTFLVYTLAWHTQADLENQMCSVKKWHYPTCLPRAKEILRHSPTPDDWVDYRAAFQRAVLKTEHFSLDPTNWTNGSHTGFAVPIRIEYSEERGRGIYAAAFIPQGTLIWDNRYTARLRTECEGKRFVRELTNDQACNVIIWGYAADHGTGKLEWGIDLDPASFMNAGKTPSEVNVEDRLVDPAKALIPGGHTTWSIRDIEEGEELLLSYDSVRDSNPMKNLWWQAKGVFMSWGWQPFLFL